MGPEPGAKGRQMFQMLERREMLIPENIHWSAGQTPWQTPCADSDTDGRRRLRGMRKPQGLGGRGALRSSRGGGPNVCVRTGQREPQDKRGTLRAEILLWHGP